MAHKRVFKRDARQVIAAEKNAALRKRHSKLSAADSIYTAADKVRKQPKGTALKERLNAGAASAKVGKQQGRGQQDHKNMRSAGRDMKRTERKRKEQFESRQKAKQHKTDF